MTNTPTPSPEPPVVNPLPSVKCKKCGKEISGERYKQGIIVYCSYKCYCDD
jgi:hypothetical protein